jgi:hypothetical protein
VKFQVYEVSDDTDMNTFVPAIVPQDTNQSASGEDVGARSARRSSRKRRKCAFTLNVEMDANVAKLKLLALERTKIKHASDIVFYLCHDRVIPLQDDINEQNLLQLLGGAEFINDPCLLLVDGSQNVTMDMAELQEKDEMVISYLMSMVGEYKDVRKQEVERGFQGTLLQSTPKCSSSANGPKVDVVELVE